jgi:hypothetical protein
MRSVALITVLMLSAAIPVAAQAQPRKIELAIGALASGASSASVTRAELIDSAGNPVTLFEATHRTSVGVGVDAGLLYRWRPAIAVELSGSWTRPDLETRISDDFEGADDTALSLGMHRFSAELAAVRHFGRRGAAEPYVRAGVGWFRELTTDRALVDDGLTGHAAAGLKYWVREGRRGLFGHLALRTDVRLVMRRGGLALGEVSTRWSPAVSASLVIGR